MVAITQNDPKSLNDQQQFTTFVNIFKKTNKKTKKTEKTCLFPLKIFNMRKMYEIWSADRVETTLRSRGWHQHAELWIWSRGSPDAQWFHSWCWTDSTGEVVISEVSWLDTLRMQNTADWPHMIITCPKLSWDRQGSCVVCITCLSSYCILFK